MNPDPSLRRMIIVNLVWLMVGLGAAAEEPPLDLDLWHATFAGSDAETVSQRAHLGLYPGVAGVLGTPNLASFDAHAYLSFGDGRSFSLFLGYGKEHGSPADADIYTVGLGGVRRLAAAVPQRGFHGKFVRYRRWDHRDHGIHHGLSVGTENGVGNLSLTLEVGAARSDRNHWIPTAQVAIKIAIPIWIPLSG